MMSHKSTYTIVAFMLLGTMLHANESRLLPTAYDDLLLEEYDLNGRKLLQVEVLNQFKEHEKQGSSDSSCLYHTIRNGQLFTQSLLFSDDAKECRKQLILPEHMAQKLTPPLAPYYGEYHSDDDHNSSSDGSLSPSSSSEDMSSDGELQPTWRGFIADKIVEAQRRNNLNYVASKSLYTKPSYTDSPDNEFAQPLLNKIQDEARLGDRLVCQVPVYYSIFENAYGYDIKRDSVEFEERLLENMQNIKTKLDNDEDLIGIIAIHTHSTTINPRTKRKESGAKLYNGSTKNNGHYILLCVASLNGKREYIVADSASVREHFTKNPAVRDLLIYFESKNLKEPISLTDMEQRYSFEEDSHLYNGFIATLLGSPRKDQEGSLDNPQSNVLYYPVIAVLACACYYFYGKAADQPIQADPIVS